MNFQKTDLLNGKKLLEVFNTLSPNTKAKIIAEKLKQYICIDRFDKMYFFQQNITYRNDSSTDRFFTVVTEFLNESYLNMDTETKEKLAEQFEKRKDEKQFVKANISNNAVKSYEHQLMTYLKDDTLEMDSYTWQLHFNNGYINLKNGEFKKRKRGVDFVT